MKLLKKVKKIIPIITKCESQNANQFGSYRM